MLMWNPLAIRVDVLTSRDIPLMSQHARVGDAGQLNRRCAWQTLLAADRTVIFRRSGGLAEWLLHQS